PNAIPAAEERDPYLSGALTTATLHAAGVRTSNPSEVKVRVLTHSRMHPGNAMRRRSRLRAVRLTTEWGGSRQTSAPARSIPLNRSGDCDAPVGNGLAPG